MIDIKQLALTTLNRLDNWMCSLEVRFGFEFHGILFFLFHNVFQDKNEILSGVADPQQGMTLEDFDYVLSEIQRAGYSFVSAEQILQGLPEGKFVHITFDDGYYNNFRILQLLEKYHAPISLFVSTRPIKMQKSFWWDALYRVSSKEDYASRVREMKGKKNDEIEAELTRQFGAQVLIPTGDADRPMTIEELKTIARHPLVEIGNHTASHAILTHYQPNEARAEILECETDLTIWLGKKPRLFAYPNGNYSEASVRILDELGYQMGITSDFMQNFVQGWQGKIKRLTFGRYSFSSAARIDPELLRFRSSLSPYIIVKNSFDYFR